MDELKPRIDEIGATDTANNTIVNFNDIVEIFNVVDIT